jgi:hypothetical protein
MEAAGPAASRLGVCEHKDLRSLSGLLESEVYQELFMDLVVPEDKCVSSKCRQPFNKRRSVISQKTGPLSYTSLACTFRLHGGICEYKMLPSVFIVDIFDAVVGFPFLLKNQFMD